VGIVDSLGAKGLVICDSDSSPSPWSGLVPQISRLRLRALAAEKDLGFLYGSFLGGTEKVTGVGRGDQPNR
jgi:hypothetical protein